MRPDAHLCFSFFFLMIRRPPRSPFFPYTPLFRSGRFPLAILAIAAVLEGIEEYAIVDGNVDPDPGRTLDRFMSETGANLLAVSVIPGPQMAAAIPLCSEFRRKYPSVPIPWGGYIPSLLSGTTLNAPYAEFAVRRHGEETLLDIIFALL